MSHEKRIAKVYFRELGGSFAIYALLLVGGLYFAKSMPDGLWRTALVLSPMAGFALMIWAISRQLARKDEYMRLRLLETIGVAAAITAGFCVTYGFLEGVGYPRLSMFTVWTVLGGSVALVHIGRRLLNK